ncbi:MAG TPA: hypothetical protein VF734_12920 [Pseudonocardiaceae bacterium]
MGKVRCRCELTQASLAEAIGMVTQDTYLLHSTIAGNLRYARPDATQDEIEAAARAANIHDRSLSFAQGYDPPMLAEELA